MKGAAEPDASLRDTENVPLSEDIDEYVAREVTPYAWIDASSNRDLHGNMTNVTVQNEVTDEDDAGHTRDPAA